MTLEENLKFLVVREQDLVSHNGEIGLWVTFKGLNGSKLFTYDKIAHKKRKYGIFTVELRSIAKKEIEHLIRIYCYSWWYVFYKGYSVVFLPHKFLKFSKNFETIGPEIREFIHAWRSFNSRTIRLRAKYNCGAKWCCDGKFDK